MGSRRGWHAFGALHDREAASSRRRDVVQTSRIRVRAAGTPPDAGGLGLPAMSPVQPDGFGPPGDGPPR
jgi:hypothetical protein